MLQLSLVQSNLIWDFNKSGGPVEWSQSSD